MYIRKKLIILIVPILIFIAFICINYNNGKVFKINENKIKYISYSSNNSTFDITDILDKEDIHQIIKELNNGVLKPDNKEIVGNPSATIQMEVINDRLFRINRQQDDIFVVRYSIDPVSNSHDDEKHTTFKSEVLKKYFNKLEEQSKKLHPISY